MKFLERNWTIGLQSFDFQRWFNKANDTSSLNQIKQLCQDILDSDGEYSTMLLAKEFQGLYAALNELEQSEFFAFLDAQFDIELDHLDLAVQAFKHNGDAHQLHRLINLTQSARRHLFSRLNLAPRATQELVKLRADVLKCRKQNIGKSAALDKLDLDLLLLFRDWFNRGFLEMRQIDWHSSADVLEKIIAYEAVHTINTWGELRRRLVPEDRLCFGFFHPSMPDEPLVFIELALTKELPSKMTEILEERENPIAAAQAKCAVFYSISNCHRGLSGVSFGNYLIKHVVAYLRIQYPHIEQFATISPLPSFTKWLAQHNMKAHSDIEAQAAHYLVNAKNERGFPFDPVARFHLRNGAQLFRVLANANASDGGQAQSLGTMVNYVYDLDSLANNHEDYVKNQHLAVSDTVKKLAARLD